MITNTHIIYIYVYIVLPLIYQEKGNRKAPYEKKKKIANLQCKPDDEVKTKDVKAITDEIGDNSFKSSSPFSMLITSTTGCA
jgi:hypothetical protein